MSRWGVPPAETATSVGDPDEGHGPGGRTAHANILSTLNVCLPLLFLLSLYFGVYTRFVFVSICMEIRNITLYVYLWVSSNNIVDLPFSRIALCKNYIRM